MAALSGIASLLARLVDGDGSLGCYAKRPGSEPSPQFRLCGEGRALLAFTKFLRDDGSTGARLTVRPHKSIYCVGTTGWSAARIVQLLYEDAPVALDRKAETARLIIAKYRDMLAGRAAAAAVAGQRSGAVAGWTAMDFPDAAVLPDLDAAWMQLTTGHLLEIQETIAAHDHQPGRYVLPQMIITPEW